MKLRFIRVLVNGSISGDCSVWETIDASEVQRVFVKNQAVCVELLNGKVFTVSKGLIEFLQ